MGILIMLLVKLRYRIYRRRLQQVPRWINSGLRPPS
jgi:hypothetical protein